jgi:hypothetical protein
MIILESGNVGIGETSPDSTLTVGGNFTATTTKPTVSVSNTTSGGSLGIRGLSPILAFDKTAGGVPKILMDGGGLEFKNGTLDAQGDVHLKIDSDGNVGIGGTPSTFANFTNVTIQGGSSGSNLDFKNSSGTRVSAIVTTASNELIIETGTAQPMIFKTNDTERMRIDSVGKATFRSTYIVSGLYGGEVTLGGSSTTFGLQLKYNQDAATTSTIYHSPGYVSNDNSFKLGSGSGNTNQLVLKGNGKIGIGTDSPSAKLQIDTSSGNNLTIRKGTGTASLAFGGVTNNEATFLIEGNGNQGFKVYNGTGTLASPTWTAGMDFYDQGRLHPYGGVFLGSSNNSNLLDDYEEGTWTPTIKDLNGNLATLSAASGTYTKIGRQVILNYRVVLSSKGSMAGNYVLMGGIPFNHPQGTNGTGTVDYFYNLDVAYSSLSWDTTSTGSVCWLVGVGANGSGSTYYVTPSTFGGNETLKGSVIYTVS